MADEDVKINAFGKTYGKVGDEKTNLCLATAGDVKIKTANSYVTIFKNGKLNVDDTKVVYSVSSMEEAKKNALYVIGEATSEDEESEGTETTDEESGQTKESKKDVYLYIDGETILLASTSDAYISYGIEQALTAEQFLRALKNIGFYFATLEDAKKTSITDGLVYILEEGKMYKVVGGEYSDYLATDEIGDEKENEEAEEAKTLSVGDIFIDGENKLINANTSFKIEVNGVSYAEFSNGKITINKDITLYDGFTIKSRYASQGEAGFMIYEEDNNIVLEVDSLIVHNGLEEYVPSATTIDIAGSSENIILSAEGEEDGVELSLKYANTFAKGDKIAAWTAANSALEISINELGEDDEEAENYSHVVVVTTDHISTETKIKVAYMYYINTEPETEDEEATLEAVTKECEVTLEMYSEYEDDDDDETVEYAYGKTYIKIDDDYIESEGIEVTGITFISGDSSVYYGNGERPLVPVYGEVIVEDPLVVNFVGELTDSEIEGLKNSKIVLICSDNKEERVIYREGANVEIREYDNELNYISYTTIGETENGEGIFTENLTAPSAWCGAIIFSNNEYATYDPISVDVSPSIEEIKQLGDEVIPSLGMVRALIEEALTETLP